MLGVRARCVWCCDMLCWSGIFITSHTVQVTLSAESMACRPVLLFGSRQCGVFGKVLWSVAVLGGLACYLPAHNHSTVREKPSSCPEHQHFTTVIATSLLNLIHQNTAEEPAAAQHLLTDQ